jgi:hypothetical protein
VSTSIEVERNSCSTGSLCFVLAQTAQMRCLLRGRNRNSLPQSPLEYPTDRCLSEMPRKLRRLLAETPPGVVTGSSGVSGLAQKEVAEFFRKSETMLDKRLGRLG